MSEPLALDLTLVIDIGKTHAKLLLLDDLGAVVERHSRANASVPSPLGYPALDVHGLQDWMQVTLRASAHAMRCGHAIVSTHGAAMVALQENSLAWEPLDYEFEDVAQAGVVAAAFAAASDSFQSTLSPDLPAGLNAARQLFWLQDMHPEAWRRTRCLLPYAQYWTWLLSGVACSEVSSLGCHTHLWKPEQGTYSDLAVARGWASLFAPVRRAWEVVGTVPADVALAWGLPPQCQVHVGVHDSNACLARYLGGQRDAEWAGQALTIVSSGTWTVLMAPGAPAAALQADKDMLGNVDVTGRMTPTARFMGGREFSALLGDADPQDASLVALQALIDSQTCAFPAFAQQGGPFAGREGYLERAGQRLDAADLALLDPAARATLAACYCAQLTAWLICYLWNPRPEGPSRVVVEGPLAGNAVFLAVLQNLLPQSACYASTDALEGTARGAWFLSRWADSAPHAELQAVADGRLEGLGAYHGYWLVRLAANPHPT
jgi:sugar (pentulose or hexulose) kinase